MLPNYRKLIRGFTPGLPTTQEHKGTVSRLSAMGSVLFVSGMGRVEDSECDSGDLFQCSLV
jgi:hypothetical protein